MKFITVILKEVDQVNWTDIKGKMTSFFKAEKEEIQVPRSVFGAIVRKEFTDAITSWRIIILLAILLVTCVSSLYTAVSTIQEAFISSEDAHAIARDSYLFLQIFTVSDGTLPSFITFVSFLGPLLGIALGFDAINSERNKGTLSRLMAQPIPRDYVIIGKFIASLLLCLLLFFSLGFLVMALGILILGIPPTVEEFFRVFTFLFLCIVYIAFWLNLGILFSVVFRNSATSALSSLAIWIFYNVFYDIIVNMLSKSILSSESIQSMEQYLDRSNFVLFLYRLSPDYLFSESTQVLLSPNIRTLGVYTMEQLDQAVAAPLPFDQSLLLIWPQFTGLIAATLICYGIAYVVFMRQEIRAN